MKVLKSVAKRLHINTINSNLHKTNIIYFYSVWYEKYRHLCVLSVSKEEHCIKPFVYRYCFLRERIKTKLWIKILEKFFGRPDPRTSILEPRSSNPKPRSSIPNPSSSILFPRSFMLHPSSSILDPPSPIFEPRSTILYPSSSILDPR